MYGYIYITTNLIDGKRYIGKRAKSHKDVNYLGSGIHIHRAITKYGKENFSCRVLEWCSSKWLLNAREKAWILMYNAVEDPNFYNIAYGGEGGHGEVTPETRRKLSLKNKGKPQKISEDERKARSIRCAEQNRKRKGIYNLNNPFVLHSDEEIKLAWDLIQSGYSNPDISKKTGLRADYISKIRCGRVGNHITGKQKPKSLD